MHRPAGLNLRILLTEQEIARGFAASLRARRLPERFFYWFPLSVEAWLRLCSSDRYRNYRRSLSLCQRAAPFLIGTLLARRSPRARVQWVSVGSGQGSKEMPFLRLARRRRLPMEYVPWDSSGTLLELACRRAWALGIPTLGMKADADDPSHWKRLPARSAGGTRVLSVFGNTLGAVGLVRLLRRGRETLRAGDWLLVDGELDAGRETLAGYDHPANRAFATAPLRSIGLDGSVGTLRFRLEPPRGGSAVGQLHKSFTFRRSVSVQVAGRRLRFRRGQTIAMAPSDKYDLHRMTRRLARAGFPPEDVLLSGDWRFALWLCRKR